MAGLSAHAAPGALHAWVTAFKHSPTGGSGSWARRNGQQRPGRCADSADTTAALACCPATAAATLRTFACDSIALQSQSASLGVIAGICQVLLALWKVLGSCSVLQVEAVLQNVLLRLADGEQPCQLGRGTCSQSACGLSS